MDKKTIRNGSMSTLVPLFLKDIRVDRIVNHRNEIATNGAAKMLTGELIRKARLEANLSKAELARRNGVHKSTVVLWEQNVRLPKNLEKLALTLNVPPEEIQGENYKSAKCNNYPIHKELISSTDVIRLLRAKTGRSINPNRLHEFIQKKGLKAYENPLRLNREGEPTLLFRESEVLDWLDGIFRPINAEHR